MNSLLIPINPYMNPYESLLILINPYIGPYGFYVISSEPIGGPSAAAGPEAHRRHLGGGLHPPFIITFS